MTSVSTFSNLSLITPMRTAAPPVALLAQPDDTASPPFTLTPAPSNASAAMLAGSLASMQPHVASALTWEKKSSDAVTSLMTVNYMSPSLSGRFQGLGAALLNRLGNGGGDFSQSVLQSTTQAVTSNTMSQNALHGDAANQLTLDIKTADGATVKLSLGSQDNGLAVQIKSSGKLSDADRGALTQLAGAFQSAIDGLVAVPAKLDLAGLTQYNATLLSSVDLHAQVQTSGGQARTLAFHADSTQRTVSADGPDGSIKVSVDLNHLSTLGNSEQRSDAIDAYLKQFDQAGSRGNANPAMLSMFKDAFKQMNSASPQQDGAASRVTLTDADHAMLTGLADFSASVTDKPNSPNPTRPGEADTFSYQASQTTSVGGHGTLDRTISQQQHTHLEASFHQPLSADSPLALDGTRQSQNYFYKQVSDDASSDSEIGYSKGLLSKASLQQTASQSTYLSKYVMGQLTEDNTTPSTATLSRDLTGLLQSTQKPGLQTAQDVARNPQTLAAIRRSVLLQSDPAQLRAAGGA